MLDYTTRGLTQSIKLPEQLGTGLYLLQLSQGEQVRGIRLVVGRLARYVHNGKDTLQGPLE